MEVAQRGTSFTDIDTNAKYPVDRFLMTNSTGSARHTGTQDTDSPVNFKNSIKSNCTTASSSLTSNSLDQFKIEHRVEEKGFEWVQFGTANAQALTLSFYIKSSQTGDTAVALVNSDNTRSFVHKFTISSTDWQRVTVNVPGDTGSNWHNGTIGIRIRWGSFGTTYQTSTFDQWQGAQKMTTNSNQINFAAATGNTLQITGVQLEVGSQATAFEHRSYGEELSLCQRYYFKYLEGITKEIGAAWYYTSSHASFFFQFPVPMRAVPTGTDTTGTDYYIIYRNGGSDALNSVTFENGSTEQYSAYNNSEASGTAGQCGLIRSSNSSSKIEFSAEL